MAQVVLWQAGSGNENMMLRVTYTAGMGYVQIHSIEGARYDGYRTYSSSSNGRVNINIGGSITQQAVYSVNFNANSDFSTFSGATAYRTATGTVTVTISFSGYGVANIDNSVFSFSVLALQSPRAPSGCTHVRNSDTRNTVSWSYIGTTNPLAAVYLERSTSGGSWSVLTTLAAGTTSYQDNSTQANQYYTYRVRTEWYGNWSAYSTSNTTTYNTPAAPGRPSGSRNNDNSISLSFTNTGKTQTATEIQRSTDNSSWATVATITGTNVTSATNSPGGGTFYYRVRNTRGSLASAWSTASLAIVTIIAPAAPTLIYPVNSVVINKAIGNIVFQWLHNPLDGAAQSSAEIRYSINNGSTWTTQTVTGSAKSFTLTNNFDVNANVVWQARTKGAHADFGAWSASGSFRVFQVPSLIITIPEADSRLEDMPLTITWEYSDVSGSQVIATISLLDDGKEVYQKIISGTQTTYSITKAEFLPDNLKTYVVRISVRSSTTLTASTETSFVVDYIPPSVPVGNLTINYDLGATQIIGFQGSGKRIEISVPPSERKELSQSVPEYEVRNTVYTIGPTNTTGTSLWGSGDWTLNNTTDKPKLFKVSAEPYGPEAGEGEVYVELQTSGGWPQAFRLDLKPFSGKGFIFSPEFVVPPKTSRKVYHYNPGYKWEFTWSATNVAEATADFSGISELDQGKIPLIYAPEAIFVSLDDKNYLLPERGVYRFSDFVVYPSSIVTVRDTSDRLARTYFSFDFFQTQILNSGIPISPVIDVQAFTGKQVFINVDGKSYQLQPGKNTFPELTLQHGINNIAIGSNDGLSTPAMYIKWTEYEERTVELVNAEDTVATPRITTFQEGVILKFDGYEFTLDLGEQSINELAIPRGTKKVSIEGNTETIVLFNWEFIPAETDSIGIFRRHEDRLVTLVESAPSGTGFYDAYPPLDQDFEYVILAYTESGLTAQEVIPVRIPSYGCAFFNFGGDFKRVAKIALDTDYKTTLTHKSEIYQTAAVDNPFPLVFYGSSSEFQGSISGTAVRKVMQRDNFSGSHIEDLNALAAWRGVVLMRLPYESAAPVNAVLSNSFSRSGTVSKAAINFQKVRADGLVI